MHKLQKIPYHRSNTKESRIRWHNICAPAVMNNQPRKMLMKKIGYTWPHVSPGTRWESNKIKMKMGMMIIPENKVLKIEQ